MGTQGAGQEKKANLPAAALKSPPGKPFTLFANRMYSSTNVIGVDIGSAYVKILQLEKAGMHYNVRNVVTRAIPQQARENSAEKRRLVGELVRGFVAEARIKTRLGRIALAGKGIFIFSLTVPPLSKKDLKGAVGIELKKRLPFQLDMSNVTYDFFVTGQGGDEKAPLLQVTCIAGDKASVDEHVQMLKEMDLTPVGIFTVPDCLGNLVPLCLESPSKGTVTLLDIGAASSQLNFYKGKQLIFSREIPIGGDHFSQAMAKTIVTPSGPVTITLEDAEKLKPNSGIPLEEEAKEDYLTDFGQFKGEQIAAMLRPVLERMVMEINRTISYYVKTFRSEKIEELYLSGGSSRFQNLDKFLLCNLDGMQSVKPLNILKAVKGWSERKVLGQELMMEQAAPHLAVAFGLCLGQGGQVNLLPMREKLEQKANLLSMLLTFAFPAILVLNLAFYGFTYVTGLKYKLLSGKLEKEYQRLEPQAREITDYKEKETKFEEKKQLLDKAKGKQPYWLGVFKELSVILPPEVILTRIETVENKRPVQLVLRGRIYPRYTIVDLALSQMVMTLEDSPYFSQVELVSSKTNSSTREQWAEFEIICNVNY